jgi:hypothetical protein
MPALFCVHIHMIGSKDRAMLVTAVIGGSAGVVLTDVLTDYFHLADSFALWAIAGASFFIVALIVGLQSSKGWSLGAVFIAVGIVLGVIVDAVVQEGFRGHSRNLWPLAIVFFLVLAVPTAGIGLALGRAIAGRLGVSQE